MVNTDDFIKRLEEILDFYSLSASAFADKLNVQRSGLSHLLSGRNKPSLDFVMKITENFEEVDLYWLLFGKGSFPKSDMPAPAPPSLNDSIEKQQFSIQKKDDDLFSGYDNNISEQGNTPMPPSKPTSENQLSAGNENTSIERIVIFYKNGTFKNYLP